MGSTLMGVLGFRGLGVWGLGVRVQGLGVRAYGFRASFFFGAGLRFPGKRKGSRPVLCFVLGAVDGSFKVPPDNTRVTGRRVGLETLMFPYCSYITTPWYTQTFLYYRVVAVLNGFFHMTKYTYTTYSSPHTARYHKLSNY